MLLEFLVVLIEGVPELLLGLDSVVLAGHFPLHLLFDGGPNLLDGSLRIGEQQRLVLVVLVLVISLGGRLP